MKNIWLINHYAVPPQYYPLARQTNFAKHLMRMGHTVTIFAASSVHNSNLNLITDATPWREETVNGVRYVYIKCCDYQGNGLKRIYNMCEFAWKLPGVCKHFPRPDALVATSMPPMSCAAGIRLARKYGCRGVAEIADLWPESIVAYGIAGPKNPAVVALRWLEKWIYTRADAVVFTMEGGRDYIVEQGWDLDHGGPIDLNKTHYINNGVDMEEFDYNREHFQIADADLDAPEIFKVIYTGSIRRVNNLGLILDAAKEVTDPRVKFLIWGDGDELPALRMRVVDEGIANVVFKGRVEKKYIPDIVSRADLTFAHNSPSPLFRYGISFNKLFDCFAAGKPVLTDFSCRYNPTLQTGAGANVEQSTAQAVAEKIVEFAAMDREKYEGFCRNARKAAEDYDFKILTQKLISVIEGVSAKPFIPKKG